jgi:hypothetical protein
VDKIGACSYSFVTNDILCGQSRGPSEIKRLTPTFLSRALNTNIGLERVGSTVIGYTEVMAIKQCCVLVRECVGAMIRKWKVVLAGSVTFGMARVAFQAVENISFDVRDALWTFVAGASLFPVLLILFGAVAKTLHAMRKDKRSSENGN